MSQETFDLSHPIEINEQLIVDKQQTSRMLYCLVICQFHYYYSTVSREQFNRPVEFIGYIYLN